MRNIEFLPKAFKEYRDWIKTDRKVAMKIGDLIKDILRDPFEGIGKPEALKYEFKGLWSRRFDQEHRLIYKLEETSVIIISCFSHYQNI